MSLMQVITNEGISNYFIPICIDDYTSAQLQNLSIKEVPSIVVSEQNQRPAVYEGPQQCSEWLNNFTYNRRKGLAQLANQQRKMIQKSHMEVSSGENGPLEYIDAEMDGIADEYAYNNIDFAQAKNFIPVGLEDKYHITTITHNVDKIKNDELNSELRNLDKMRKDENSTIKRKMEEEQIRKVIMTHNNGM